MHTQEGDIHQTDDQLALSKDTIIPASSEGEGNMAVRIHATADVSDKAEIGDGTAIWHHCQVREGARIGRLCNIGKGVYVDAGVTIGDHVKIQNYVSVYHGVTVEDGVFIGPHVCFTNDMRPRAINPDGSPKAADDWELSETRIRRGAALGANSTIRCGITIGEWAMVGSGSVVTRDVPAYGLVLGNPARLRGYVCPCGTSLQPGAAQDGAQRFTCPKCNFAITIPTMEHQETIAQEGEQ
jgi:UDP-2-acetamido-3-amino-2,3-dideoxy-glucuronate N-acetyltransferase